MDIQVALGALTQKYDDVALVYFDNLMGCEGWICICGTIGHSREVFLSFDDRDYHSTPLGAVVHALREAGLGQETKSKA